MPSPTWEAPCVPAWYLAATTSTSLVSTLWCLTAFPISGFGRRIQTYMNGTMGRLRSNLCHIFGHRRAITIKVFSRSARRLGWGDWGKFEGEWFFIPWAGLSFLLRKGRCALESEEAPTTAGTFHCLRRPSCPVLGHSPVLVGGSAKCRWQSSLRTKLGYILFCRVTKSRILFCRKTCPLRMTFSI